MISRYLKQKHGYEINGLWYPRVTSICGIIAKPGLEKWLANQGSFAAMQRKRKKVTGWGNLVHETIGKILLDKKPKIEPTIQPSIDAFLDWLNNHQLKVLDVEKQVLSKEHGYIGTLDVLGEIDGQLGVLDLKTSRAIWDEYFIQTAAYVQAHNEGTDTKAKTHWILRIDQYQECELCGARKRNKAGEADIKKDNKACRHKWGATEGTCELRGVENHKVYVNTFLTAKKLWEFSNRNWLFRVENYPDRFKYAF